MTMQGYFLLYRMTQVYFWLSMTSMTDFENLLQYIEDYAGI